MCDTRASVNTRQDGIYLTHHIAAITTLKLAVDMKICTVCCTHDSVFAVHCTAGISNGTVMLDFDVLRASAKKSPRAAFQACGRDVVFSISRIPADVDG